MIELIEKEIFSDLRSEFEINYVYQEENLKFMRKIRPESIKVVIYDPDPLVQEELQKNYLLFHKKRITEIKRILKDSGFVFIFCDNSIKFKFKLMCDEIFGKNCLKKEIIFNKTDKLSSILQDFQTILVYAKSDNCVFKKLPFLRRQREYYVYNNQKSLYLIKRLIKGNSKEGELIGDFTCGSGTTMIAAKILSRNFIGCDKNPKAIEITKTRLRGL